MTQEEFSAKFKDLFTGMIQIAYDYVDHAPEVEKIYTYADLEGGNTSFNCFFQMKGEVVLMHKVNDYLAAPVETSFQRAMEILKMGTQDAKDIRTLFETFQGTAPTHLKFTYTMDGGKFDSEISYDLHHSNTDDLLASDIFTQWHESVET